MILFMFVFFTVLMIIIQSKREKNIINIMSLLMTPYVFITLGNNLFAYKMGFYQIDDKVLIMLLSAFVCFFLGNIIISPRGVPLLAEDDNRLRFEQYNIPAMTRTLLVIGIIGAIKIGQMILTGSLRMAIREDSLDILGGGLVGHLTLLSYSILPIVFMYWIENKKKISCLVSVLLIMAITFASFVKYNIIGLAVSLFIFTLMYKKSLLKRAIILLVVFTLVAFVGNYAISFWLNNVVVKSSFYTNHLWVYISGSVIYDNHIFDGSLNNGFSIFYKLGTFVFALPNMFIQKATGGFKLFPHIKKDFLNVGSLHGQTSNVTDAVGYIYPAGGDIFDRIIFLIVMFIIGMIFARIYTKGKRRNDRFDTFTCIFLAYFVFFSFFGTFYINPGPWEMLIYSIIIPKLFLKGTDLTRGVIRL